MDDREATSGKKNIMQAIQRKIQKFNINGVRVLYVRNESYLTNIQILTDVGSTAEDESIHGMAHILEHMFFKGSKKRSSGTAIARAANDIGGKMNAYTTYDHTAYYISVLNDHFEEGFDILADMYLNPLFKEEEFKKELNPIISELREREDDPDSYISEHALMQYFGQRYHPIIGTIDSINAATVDKMHDFRQRFYGGDNTLISVVGGIEEQRLIQAVENMFPPAHKTERPPEIDVDYHEGELTLTRPAIQEVYYNLFYPALPGDHPERHTQSIMAYILGGDDSAMLFERIREEKGMSCYGVYSWAMRYKPYNILGISCGIAPDELDELHEEIRHQIDKICNEKIEPERLNRCKASIRASIAASVETSRGLNNVISLPYLRGLEEDPVASALEQLEAVTAEDVIDIAQKTFSGPKFKAILLPET